MAPFRATTRQTTYISVYLNFILQFLHTDTHPYNSTATQTTRDGVSLGVVHCKVRINVHGVHIISCARPWGSVMCFPTAGTKLLL